MTEVHMGLNTWASGGGSLDSEPAAVWEAARLPWLSIKLQGFGLIAVLSCAGEETVF